MNTERGAGHKRRLADWVAPGAGLLTCTGVIVWAWRPTAWVQWDIPATVALIAATVTALWCIRMLIECRRRRHPESDRWPHQGRMARDLIMVAVAGTAMFPIVFAWAGAKSDDTAAELATAIEARYDVHVERDQARLGNIGEWAPSPVTVTFPNGGTALCEAIGRADTVKVFCGADRAELPVRVSDR